MKEKQKCTTCGSCGMPLLNPEDHAKNKEMDVCIHCVKEDGTLKSYGEIIQGTADHFVQTQGITKEAAVKIALQLIENLPYWEQREILKCTPLSVSIRAPFNKTYEFISNPENLPLYSGFVKKIYKRGELWMGETSEGILPHRIITDEQFGIFDVYVTEPNGFELSVCSRLIRNKSGCEYITTVFCPPMVNEEIYKKWVEIVRKELLDLKKIIEQMT